LKSAIESDAYEVLDLQAQMAKAGSKSRAESVTDNHARFWDRLSPASTCRAAPLRPDRTTRIFETISSAETSPSAVMPRLT
jgi:hypothetical protein